MEKHAPLALAPFHAFLVLTLAQAEHFVHILLQPEAPLEVTAHPLSVTVQTFLHLLRALAEAFV